jgi:uncharacterized protein (TIGR00725 family)
MQPHLFKLHHRRVLLGALTVFGSAKPTEGDADYEAARELGRLLASAGFIICNGGYGGIMEASARGAKEARGKTIGVVSEFFGTDANAFTDEKIVVRRPIDRLIKLVELGSGYVVFRGGTGTLVELATVWEYMNKRIIGRKPLVFLGNFWLPVTETVSAQLVREGLNDAAKYVTFARSSRECVELFRRELGL